MHHTKPSEGVNALHRLQALSHIRDLPAKGGFRAPDTEGLEDLCFAIVVVVVSHLQTVTTGAVSRLAVPIYLRWFQVSLCRRLEPSSAF